MALALSNYNTALLECAGVDGQMFISSHIGDVLFYPSNSNQGMLFGTQDNDYPAITIRNNYVGIYEPEPIEALHTSGNSIVQGYSIIGGHTNTTNASLAIHCNNNEPCISFFKNATSVGSITVTNTTTQYNTLSDYRLKDMIAQEVNGLEKIMKVPIYTYKFKCDESNMLYNGCLAHELQDVVPYAVSGDKDGDKHQTVDYSKLVPIIIDAIQDLKRSIDDIKLKLKI
jgi:hypothetical protein